MVGSFILLSAAYPKQASTCSRLRVVKSHAYKKDGTVVNSQSRGKGPFHFSYLRLILPVRSSTLTTKCQHWLESEPKGLIPGSLNHQYRELARTRSGRGVPSFARPNHTCGIS